MLIDKKLNPKRSVAPPTPEQQIKALQTQLQLAQEKNQLLEAVIAQVRKNQGARNVKKPLGKSSSSTSSRG